MKLTLNIALLEQVKTCIRANPMHFDMVNWSLEGHVRRIGDDAYQNCGTTACIAGWACAVTENDKACSLDGWKDNASDVSIRYRAMDYLLPNMGAYSPTWGDDPLYCRLDSLFYEAWSPELNDRIRKARKAYDFATQAEVACDAIDALIHWYHTDYAPS